MITCNVYVSFNLELTFDIDKETPVVDLIKFLKEFSSKYPKVVFSIPSDIGLTVCVDISHLHDDFKNEYFERDLIVYGRFLSDMADKILYYATKYKVFLKYGREITVRGIPLENIRFGENFIQNGDFLMENLIVNVDHVALFGENISKLDIDNLNSIGINKISVLLEKSEYFHRFLRQYLGKCECNLTWTYESDYYKICQNPDELKKAFYESGSLLYEEVFNKNAEWRINLFDITTIELFNNANSDLLVDPRVMNKIAVYLGEI